ncbi:MAG: hypothetical protein ACTSUE_17365 [Promethearchaeota archaeon]
MTGAIQAPRSPGSATVSRKPTLKTGLLFAGLELAIMGSVLLAVGAIIPGFSVKTELYGNEFNFNFSFFLWSAMIFAGLVLASMYFRRVSMKLGLNKLPEKHKAGIIHSIPVTRFISGALLLSLATISFLVFGLGFSNENKVGVWLYLAGPSLFFPTGLAAMIFGVLLIMYAAFAVKSVAMEGVGGSVEIIEKRPLSTIITRIEKNGVEFIRLTNARIGPRHLWSLVYIFQIWLLYVDGFAFLMNPHAFGTGILAGVMYVASATVQLVVLGLLVMCRKYNLEIITVDQIYEVQFESRRILDLHFFHSMFGIEGNGKGNGKGNGRGKGKGEDGGTSTYSPENSYTRLIAGLAFLATAIISRACLVYAGSVLRFVLLFSSAVLVTEAIMKDLHGKSASPGIRGSGTGGRSCRSARGPRVDAVMSLLQSPLPSPKRVPRKLELHDHFVTAGVSGAIGMDIISTAMLGGIDNSIVRGLVTMHVIFGIVLLILVLMVTVDIRNVIEIDAGIKKYQIFVGRIAGTSPRTSNLCKAWIEKIAVNRKQVIKRVLEITCAFSIGILLGILSVVR